MPKTQAATKFIQTFLVYYGAGPTLISSDIPTLAKFDILDISRWRYNEINSNTWAAIKGANPNAQIYLYEDGPQVADDRDAWQIFYVDNIARYNISRGSPYGSINVDNPGFFLLDSFGNRINGTSYPHSWLLDFGSSALQNYWMNSVHADIISQSWVADGIFADDCTAIPIGYSGTPVSYPTDSLWADGMNSFVAGISAGVHAYGQKLASNKGATKTPVGSSSWLALDANANHPDLLMEEGAFAVGWASSDVQFYPESEWKRQLDTEAAMQNTKIAILSHTKFASGGNGTDNYGKPVTYWQALWYSLASFLLGKNDVADNAYFMFFSQADAYGKLDWYDEYDIDLGEAVSSYTVSVVGGANVYWREFEGGYVVVNPTANNVSAFTLPQDTRRRTHDNLSASVDTLSIIPSGTNINIDGHTGSIFLKAVVNPSDTTPPAAPSGLSVS